MRTYIDHLRSKPDSHRKKVAAGTSAAITAVIALVWVTSFSYVNDPSANARVARNTENSPLTVIRRNIAGAYEAVTGAKVEFVKENNSASTTATLEYVPEPGY